MKKTALMVILVSALLIAAVAEIESVSVAWANWGGLWSFKGPPDIRLDSPLNTTYAGNVLLSFSVFASMDWVRGFDDPEIYQELNSVDYYIDGSLQGSIVANSKLTDVFRYSANLTGLQEGGHCLMVQTNSTGVQGGIMIGGTDRVPGDSAWVIVYFSVADDGIPPRVSLLSAENKTYSTANVTLTYSINDQVVKAQYTLDGQKSSNLSGNMTLTDLSEGSHDITVYAYDRVGNVALETVYFTVSMPEPFPTTLVTASVSVLAVIIVIGLFIFLKKRQRKSL